MTGTVPAVGLRFAHSRRIEGSPKAGTARPAEYVVTRVAQGTAYYRPASGGTSSYIAVERFPSVVKEVLCLPVKQHHPDACEVCGSIKRDQGELLHYEEDCFK